MSEEITPDTVPTEAYLTDKAMDDMYPGNHDSMYGVDRYAKNISKAATEQAWHFHDAEVAELRRQLDVYKSDNPKWVEIWAERDAAREQVRALMEALWNAREAIRYTQEYVGDGLLPALDGWSWYDGIRDADAALAAVKATN